MQFIYTDRQYKNLKLIFLFLLPALSIATFFTDDGMVYFRMHIAFFIALSFVSLGFLIAQQRKSNVFGFFSLIPISLALYLFLLLTKSISSQLIFSYFSFKDVPFTYIILIALVLYLTPSVYILLRTLKCTHTKTIKVSLFFYTSEGMVPGTFLSQIYLY